MNTPDAEQIHDWLLAQEDCDNDDRRFYCSYLISLSSLIMASADDDQSFFHTMKESLLEALKVDQLSDDDKVAIDQLWNEACDIPLAKG